MSESMVPTRSLLLAIGALLALGCEQVASSPPTAEAGAPSGWTVVAAGTSNLNAVSGVSDAAVWAVGDRGAIVRWDGAKVTFEPSGTTVNLRGVWAVDPDHVYAVGDGGTILQRVSGSWQAVGAGVTPQILTAVWADATRVVAVGSFGTVVLGSPGAADGGGYQLIANSDAENLMAVTGSTGGPATAVGALGLVLELNGQTLSRTPIPTFSKLLTGVATAPGVSFLVGEQGVVYESAGGALNPIAGLPATTLRAVSIVGTDAWTVGLDGTICKVSGATPTCYPYKDARWFTGVYAASPTSVWVVGASGTLLHGLPPQANPAGSGAAAGDAGGG